MSWRADFLSSGVNTHTQLREVRWSSVAFVTQEISWDEMRLQLWAVRQALAADSVLGQAIDAEMAVLTGGPAGSWGGPCLPSTVLSTAPRRI